MIIDERLLDEIACEAAASPRLRMNRNFHESLDSKAQRLINYLLPGTEIPLHRHMHTNETYLLLRGRLGVRFHNDDGSVSESFELDPLTGNYGIDIPKGQWHSLEVLAPSAIFEVKDGPYSPISPSDMLRVKS